MFFTLDDQLDELSMTIKKALKDSSCLHSDLKELFEAQKALLETMVLGRHLENLSKKTVEPEGCGGCGHEG